MQITLYCHTCENTSCEICPCGTYLPQGLHGCVRDVSSLIHDKYIHYVTEIKPFLKQYNIDYQHKIYIEIYSLLYIIYDSPIVRTF